MILDDGIVASFCSFAAWRSGFAAACVMLPAKKSIAAGEESLMMFMVPKRMSFCKTSKIVSIFLNAIFLLRFGNSW